VVLTAGPIDVYVASLHGALRGPRAAKADLVTEARDSLTDAAARYEDEGLARADAERAAVEEFGPVADLAPDFQRELALAQGRRTALLVSAAVAAQAIVSEVAWRTASTGWGWQPSAWYSLLAGTVDYASYLTVAAGLVAAIACGVGSRYVEVGRAFVRATGIAAIGIVGFFIAGGLALSAFSPMWDSGHTVTSPLSLASSALTAALPLWMVYSGTRCVRASRVTH
jgi:hypothetical protein